MDPIHPTTGYGAAVQDPGIFKPRMSGGQGVLFGWQRSLEGLVWRYHSDVSMSTGLFPDSPREIPPLGDGDGANFSPTGIQMVGKQSPSGLAGTGMGIHPPNPIPANPPRLEHIEVDLMDL